MTITYTGPLTARLLYDRTAELFKRCIAEGGDPEGIIFERVICDGCGLVVNRLTEQPIGWTTSGDSVNGWHDLCKACSR